MSRHITINDIVHQQVNRYPITVADRLSRWEHAEELHRLNRPEETSPLPPCLEIIIQGCGEAGIALRRPPAATLLRRRCSGRFRLGPADRGEAPGPGA